MVRENVELYFCLAGMLVFQCTCKFISRTTKRLNVWQIGCWVGAERGRAENCVMIWANKEQSSWIWQVSGLKSIAEEVKARDWGRAVWKVDETLQVQWGEADVVQLSLLYSYSNYFTKVGHLICCSQLWGLFLNACNAMTCFTVSSLPFL